MYIRHLKVIVAFPTIILSLNIIKTIHFFFTLTIFMELYFDR